jgi:hypothetical protein
MTINYQNKSASNTANSLISIAECQEGFETQRKFLRQILAALKYNGSTTFRFDEGYCAQVELDFHQREIARLEGEKPKVTEDAVEIDHDGARYTIVAQSLFLHQVVGEEGDTCTRLFELKLDDDYVDDFVQKVVKELWPIARGHCCSHDCCGHWRTSNSRVICNIGWKTYLVAVEIVQNI